MSAILVVGATGRLGSEICRRLTAAGKSVRGLVRATSDQAKVDALKSHGVELVQGNLRDPASLAAACRGVNAVITTTSAMPVSYDPTQNNIQNVDIEGLSNLMAAARAADVGRFVYTSFSGGFDLDFPLGNAKRTVEGRLKDSGLTHTILRPSYFMESWLGPMVGFDYPSAKAQIYGEGENLISWISVGDVAQFAVESLDNLAARNATLELGGPEALSPRQVVHIFEEIGGRTFEVAYVPVAALQEQRKAATDGMQASFVALMLCYAQGDAIDMRETLKAFPLKLKTVKEYAESVQG